MYQPGDYVVGYPDYYVSDGKRFIKRNFGSVDGDIKCHEEKGVLLNGVYSPDFYKWAEQQGLNPQEVGRVKKKGFEYIHYTKFRGMVVESDDLGDPRPHWNGVVRVLVDEKVLWVWARNLRLVKYARG